MEKSLEEMIYEPEETKNLMFMKKIDLVKALDAIVYRVKITNQLCNVKEIIVNLEHGYNKLTCTQHECSDKAIAGLKINEDSPAELYCKTHSSSVDPLSEGYRDLNSELKKSKFTLKSLERLLVVVEEQMEYLRSKEINKDIATYNKVKEQLDEVYNGLSGILNEMMMKAKRIIMKQGKISKGSKYDDLSFVKSDYEKWKSYITKNWN